MSRPKFAPPPPRTGLANSAPAPVADPDAAERFLSGADHAPAPQAKPSKAAPKALPWIDADDEARVGLYNVRFTKREKACLEYIGRHTPYSMHSFIVSVLRPAIAQKIMELTGDSGADIKALLEPVE
ncbi:MAG: hypothetical protein EPN79_15930 [Burkholderiaceae bacterium]|nr:MAG: hypothetical protein EPN79_15930 [Burkholderiaceae bacterium]